MSECWSVIKNIIYYRRYIVLYNNVIIYYTYMSDKYIAVILEDYDW